MERSATQRMVEPLKKYATFSGWARRAEFWWFQLLLMLTSLALLLVDMAIFGPETVANYSIGPLSGLFSLTMLIPSLAVTVRRLHDRDRSGWWFLIAFIPFIGTVIILIWCARRGTTGENRFGMDPIAP